MSFLDIFKKKRREKTGADFERERTAKKEQKKEKEIRSSKGGGRGFSSGHSFRARLLAWNRALNLSRLSDLSRKRGLLPKNVLHSDGMRSLRTAGR